MIRTRDFFLFVVIIVFLLVAIGAALFSPEVGDDALLLVEFTDGVTETNSVFVDSTVPDRESLRNTYREKIAAGVTLYIQDDFYEADDIATSDPVVDDSDTVIRCPDYAIYSGPLLRNTEPLQFVEGARVIYEPNNQPAISSTSTAVARDIALTLPLAGVMSASTNCLPSDVVGVTLGGTLIKNTDGSRYAQFAQGTLIGYALDGFPIYGPTILETDICGGNTVSGAYRYHIQVDQPLLFNCFTGVPVSI